jgi:hypothetical protein
VSFCLFWGILEGTDWRVQGEIRQNEKFGFTLIGLMLNYF